MAKTSRAKPKYRIGDIIEEWSYYTSKDNFVREYIEHYLIVNIVKTYVDHNRQWLYYEVKSLKMDNLYSKATRMVDMRNRVLPNKCNSGYRKVA